MTIGLELSREIKQLADDMLAGDYPDAISVRNAVRTVAKCYGIGTGYVYNRMTEYVQMRTNLTN